MSWDYLRPLSSRLCQCDDALNRRLHRRLDLETAENAAGIALENLVPVGIAQSRRVVDVTLGIVEIKSGLGVDAFDRADHLGGEQDIVDRTTSVSRLIPGW